MAGPAVHLIEAGIVTEPWSAGATDAPAALAPAFAERLRPEKRIRIPFNPRDRLLTAAREACRTLADAVAGSLGAGGLPVILGGGCALVAGTVSGALAREPELVLVYVDAHADYHTLATTRTHDVAGMALAHVAGHPVAPLLWPGAKRIADDRVVLVGGRAMDPGEASNLSRSRIRRVALDASRADAAGLLEATRGAAVWVHLDVDVIDPADCPAVIRPAPDGPRLKVVADVLHQLGTVATIRGVEVCGYDVTMTGAEKIPDALARLVHGLIRARHVG